jgi:hypothetical protein
VQDTIDALMQLSDTDLYRPPFVATVVSLLERSNDNFDKASQIFNDAIEYWKAEAKENPNVATPVYITLLKAAGEFFLKHKRGDKAVAYYSAYVALLRRILQ